MEDKLFNAKRKYVSCEQLLKATPDRIFPLLCPKREFDWLETWKCDILFTKSGYAESDCVFRTDVPGDVKETWLIDRYEKNKTVQFIKFSEQRVIRYGIILTDNKNSTTAAKWEQTITSLNADGNLFIENFSDSEFEKKIKNLEKQLNYYLETGKMLRTINN
jgi:hypothetical protein